MTDEVLARLTALRAADPPTHGGHVLSYVYDHGRPELDVLTNEAARLFAPVNGLDPTTFRSVAVIERDLVRFARSVLGGAESRGQAAGRDEQDGDHDVVGSVTSGGTESCLLAVKTARDVWRATRAEHGGHREHGEHGEHDEHGEHSGDDDGDLRGAPRLVLPTTAHPAFRKAAHYLGLTTVEVPVDPATGVVDAARLLAAVEQDAARTALVVVSAPSYPYGGLDPVAEVAAGAAELGVACHVDACLGGWVLPWWPGDLAPWDLRVPGVTSLSADLHKYGYAPKGVSVLLHRGRDRHRRQYFATKAWPGYPVVNPTMLGSRAAGPMAAAWAVVETLGTRGFADLVARTARATATVRAGLEDLVGLRVVGTPTGPVLAVGTDTDVPADRQVDPFRFVDEMRNRGWLLQSQPGLVQSDGSALPRTAHLTLTAVTEAVADGLVAELRAGADAVRGIPAAVADPGVAEAVATQGLPQDMATIMATLEALPADVVEPLLVQVLAAVVDPDG